MPGVGAAAWSVSKPSFSWASYWSSRLDTWYNEFGYDTFTPVAVSANDMTDIQYYYQTDINPESVYNQYVLAFRWGEVLLSDDNGVTYKYKNRWFGKNRVENSRIFSDGSVMWATCDGIFYSHDLLATINASTILDASGNPYTPPLAIGNNYRSIMYSDRATIGGYEIYVWGTYVNVNEANAPSIIFYTRDKGATVKICYEFGQNPSYGNYGDPANPLTVRHLHCINYNPADGYFYAQTGDGLLGATDCRWLRGSYNATTDTWTWTQVANGTNATPFKSAGLIFIGNDLYVVSDATGDNTKWNIMKGDYSDLANLAKYSRVHTGANVASNGKRYANGDFIMGEGTSNKIIVSKDGMQTFAVDTIVDAQFVAGYSFTRFSDKTNDGWILCNYTDSGIVFRMFYHCWIKIK